MFKVGDRVLAMWPVEMVWWYPATVVGTYNEFFDVSYDTETKRGWRHRN